MDWAVIVDCDGSVFSIWLVKLTNSWHQFEYSLNNRLLIINSAVDLFREHWFLGMSYNEIKEKLAYLMYMNSENEYYYSSDQIYNTILNISVWSGVVGLLAFLFLFLRMLKDSYMATKSVNLDMRILGFFCSCIYQFIKV